MSITNRVLLIILMVAIGSSQPSYASSVNLGTLSSWYSNTSEINRWKYSSVLCEENVYSGFTMSDFRSHVTFATSTWSSIMYFNYTSGSSSTCIYFLGGNLVDLNNMNIGFDSSMEGLTNIIRSSEGYWVAGSGVSLPNGASYAGGGALQKASIYIRYNQPSGAPYTTNRFNRNTTHELGHALGYHGHPNASGLIMSLTANDKQTITASEKNHLQQVKY